MQKFVKVHRNELVDRRTNTFGMLTKSPNMVFVYDYRTEQDSVISSIPPETTNPTTEEQALQPCENWTSTDIEQLYIMQLVRYHDFLSMPVTKLTDSDIYSCPDVTYYHDTTSLFGDYDFIEIDLWW